MSAERPVVLFICTHNAGRSQLGAHLLDHLAGDRYDATSAGVAPAEGISPEVAEALGELGIDTSAASPRPVTAELLAEAHVVVTMKPGLDLPGAVAGELVQWQFPNPESWGLEGVRELRDHIRAAVEDRFV
ncbi:arsenate-mycothiol transferase ArsC [Microbacterium aquimaris]|uniref:Low molecular weight phosphatase family protein n=1 Tax=Microbacterium aquimaris TaxID=459816 RepID=A0ABU5N506_9MICO|nr:low molecular weight phosphatase family protein [Microbacterium aquimaris]MDZ8161165.1 low molecular weight phosphatase family protein [Microbacterium aquimaris]